MEFVTLVDEHDRPCGEVEKMEAHRHALLHRACSVVLFNDRGDVLLQKRNPKKYHSGGLWSNTCCTHPRPGESPHHAARRRLREEMGIEAELRPAFNFIYRAELDDDLVEHEYDHVFVGVTSDTPIPHPEEVADWRWAPIEEVAHEIDENAEAFSRWFPILFERLRNAV